MTDLMIFASMLFLGFSCSMGCGSVSSTFVLGTQIGKGCDVKSCVRAIALFSLGKIVSLAIMGFLSSIFGMIILNFIEEIYPNSTIWIVRIVTCMFGVSIIFSVLKQLDFNKLKNKNNIITDIDNTSLQVEEDSSIQQTCSPSACSSCSGCASKTGAIESKKVALKGSYFLAGLLYATIPCAPLVTTLTYASTMSPPLATLLLALFGVTNSIVPIFVHATIIGQANKELEQETPYLMKPLKIFGGGLLIYVGLFIV